MPLRPLPPLFLRPASAQQHLHLHLQSCAHLKLRTCAFSTTARAFARHDHHHPHISPSKNHYERLGIRHDASPAEIKKSFYKLSKTHHPDTNPNDPTAASTFSLLSESYTILSDPSRRATYDRDVLRLHQQSHTGTGSDAPHRGSYHSAGGRPASGLSRRKGTFRGPPPSFYRSGGYGAHEARRRRAHEESTSPGAGASGSTSREEQYQQQQRQQQGGSRYGGMGPGDDPFGHQDDVPHFDRQGHHRTQKREDERRWQRTHRRRAVDDDDVEFEPQMSIGSHFMVILTLLSISFAAPAVYFHISRGKKRTKKLDSYG